MRYQQVYAASAFSALAPEGEFITTLQFFPDEVHFPMQGTGSTIRSIQINLSITLQPVDSLSPVFAENVGFNDTVVYGPAPLFLRASRGQRFIIPLTTPFLYNPTLGNLLLDVRNYQSPEFGDPNRPSMDAQRLSSDAVSRAYADSVDATTAQVLDTLGLFTGFVTEPIPEPGTPALFLAGGGVLALLFLASQKERRLA